MFLLRRCTDDMNRRTMFHWNRFYPHHENILEAIREKNLYVYKDLGITQGIIVLDQHQAVEYQNIDWEDDSGRILVVHNLAVHPVFQQRGIGKKLMEFAVDLARKEGYESLRLDVFRDHTSAGRLYREMGFREAGSFRFPYQKCPFICYEMKI